MPGEQTTETTSATQTTATTTATTTEATTTPATRPDHIPEKFWDAASGSVKVEDLAKAYAGLESEFTKSRQAASTATTTTTTTTPATTTTESTVEAVKGIDEAALYNEVATRGTVSPETLASLKQSGLSDTMINTIVTSITTTQKAVLTEVLGAAGLNHDSYAVVIKWAEANLSKEALDGFRKSLGSGAEAAKMAVIGLTSIYKDKNGFDASTKIYAAPSAGNAQGFATADDYYKAVRDPRYHQNRQYRMEVDAKFESSTFYR